MTSRILPPSEWPKLEGTSLGTSWRVLPTTGVTIVVVEDVDGTIVGHSAVFHAVHAEDWWIAAVHRKRGVVAGYLVAGVKAAALRSGAVAFITAAESEEVTHLLKHLGAARLPGDPYSVPAEG